MKAIGYVRVSRVSKRSGDSFLSPELQRQSIERVCQRRGLELVDVLEELDKSGGDTVALLWNKAIEMVERGEAGALVVWNLSRFSRSLPDALGAIARIGAAGGRLLSEEGATGKLERNILQAVAEDYRDKARDSFQRVGRARSSAASISPRECRLGTRAIRRRGGSCQTRWPRSLWGCSSDERRGGAGRVWPCGSLRRAGPQGRTRRR